MPCLLARFLWTRCGVGQHSLTKMFSTLSRIWRDQVQGSLERSTGIRLESGGIARIRLWRIFSFGWFRSVSNDRALVQQNKAHCSKTQDGFCYVWPLPVFAPRGIGSVYPVTRQKELSTSMGTRDAPWRSLTGKTGGDGSWSLLRASATVLSFVCMCARRVHS